MSWTLNELLSIENAALQGNYIQQCKDFWKNYMNDISEILGNVNKYVIGINIS
jgi:hypothetical protein